MPAAGFPGTISRISWSTKPLFRYSVVVSRMSRGAAQMPALSSWDPPLPSLKYVRSPRMTSMDDGEMEIDCGVFICTSAPVPVGTPPEMNASW